MSSSMPVYSHIIEALDNLLSWILLLWDQEKWAREKLTLVLSHITVGMGIQTEIFFNQVQKTSALK